MKHFKKFDKFGEKFSFKYNGYDKYSTRVGGFICLIICLISLSNFILYFIPFILKKNFTLQFYTINLEHTEEINLEKSFIFGIDCGNKALTQKAYDNYFDLKVEFKSKDNTNIMIPTKKCEKKDLDEKLNETLINNLTINELGIEDFHCLLNKTNKVEGIYTDQNFTCYKITVSAKAGKTFNEINNFLYGNGKKDCKLQFYYVDYSIDIENYSEPIKPLINSLFLQLNPDFYIKKNVFFMNYHFKSDYRLFHIFEFDKSQKDEINKTGFSRVEDYFLYKGVDTSSNLSEKDKFAKLFVRVDNKKMEIKREYQNLLDFYAENSAFWVSLFDALNIILTIYNDFHANRSMSRKLFFFEEKEDNKFNSLKRRSSVSSNLSFMNKTSINDANSVNDANNITINDIEEKDSNSKNKTSMPVVYTPKVFNNFIAATDKGLNREEINTKEIKTKKEKEEEEKNKNPFSILTLYKISIYCCCKR